MKGMETTRADDIPFVDIIRDMITQLDKQNVYKVKVARFSNSERLGSQYHFPTSSQLSLADLLMSATSSS